MLKTKNIKTSFIDCLLETYKPVARMIFLFFISLLSFILFPHPLVGMPRGSKSFNRTVKNRNKSKKQTNRTSASACAFVCMYVYACACARVCKYKPMFCAGQH